MSVALETGTRTMGLFGPIPYGCLIVSKTPNELEGVDFESGCLCIGVFAGYKCVNHPCFTDQNCRGVHE